LNGARVTPRDALRLGRRLTALAFCLAAATAVACRGRFPHAVGPDQGRLVASRTGERYHRPECSLARRIASKNLLYYRTGDEAYADGFTPCHVCRPDAQGRQAVPAPRQGPPSAAGASPQP
jgi:hypothetical protein